MRSRVPFAERGGRPVIGVALHSREAYRDYPAMPQLLMALAERYTVLAIHSTSVSSSMVLAFSTNLVSAAL